MGRVIEMPSKFKVIETLGVYRFEGSSQVPEHLLRIAAHNLEQAARGIEREQDVEVLLKRIAGAEACLKGARQKLERWRRDAEVEQGSV